MDASTRSKIDSALVIAEMTMDITNGIPFGGDISLLVSEVQNLNQQGLISGFPEKNSQGNVPWVHGNVLSMRLTKIK